MPLLTKKSIVRKTKNPLKNIINNSTLYSETKSEKSVYNSSTPSGPSLEDNSSEKVAKKRKIHKIVDSPNKNILNSISCSNTTNSANSEHISSIPTRPEGVKAGNSSKKVSKNRKIHKAVNPQNNILNSTTFSDTESQKSMNIFSLPSQPKGDAASKSNETASFTIQDPVNIDDEEYEAMLSQALQESEKLSSEPCVYDIPEVKNAFIEFMKEEGERAPSPLPCNLSKMDTIKWLQEHRQVGLYVLCDRCNKQRYLPNVYDPLELPDKWFCEMNPDKTENLCAAPEKPISPPEEVDLIHNEYNAGSIVYAQIDGYPWWPAMVDDDPDLYMYYWLEPEKYGNVPTWYHVTFFDSRPATRAWVKPSAIVSFRAVQCGKIKLPKLKKMEEKLFFRRIQAAKEQAADALTLNLADRLKKYCFLSKGSPGAIKCITAEKTKDSGKKKIKSKTQKIIDADNKQRKMTKNSDRNKPKSKVQKNADKNRKKKDKWNFLDDSFGNISLSDIMGNLV